MRTRLYYLTVSRKLFMKPISTKKRKSNFKIRFYDTIHILKNYFTIIFLIFNF